MSEKDVKIMSQEEYEREAKTDEDTEKEVLAEEDPDVVEDVEDASGGSDEALVRVDGVADYNAIRGDVEQPTKVRQSIISKRGNRIVPRRYHLVKGKMEKIISEAEKSGKFPNPYRKGGIYFSIVEALSNLGTDKFHSFDVMKIEISKIMSSFPGRDGTNAWDYFVNKVPKQSMSGKDSNGRILQNAQVLQRLTGMHPYGEKLRQLCACIDIHVGEDKLPLFCLKTTWDKSEDVKPVNQLRTGKRGRTKKKEVKKKEVIEADIKET